MDIRLLDDADLADDNVLHERWELNRRAELVGREGAPFWGFEEFCGAMRSRDSGERRQLFGAHDGGRLVATAALWSPLLDNTDKCGIDVDVDPPAQRRGVGRTLVAEVEGVAAADDRRIILGGAKVPVGGQETHGSVLFAAACGYEVANVDVVRHLDLPVDDATIQGWVDEAAPAHDGYLIETLVDHVPEDLRTSLGGLMGQLIVDAPTGTVDYEEESVTPQRLEERQEMIRAMGRSLFETVALAADREVVAHSTLVVPLEGSTDVYQWGTFVGRGHRGHRLGLATKAANLRAVQQAHPGLRRVTTENAETNEFMVSINERMGFVPVELNIEFVKRV